MNIVTKFQPFYTLIFDKTLIDETHINKVSLSSVT